MSPTYVVVAVVVSLSFGYAVYRSVKTNGVALFKPTWLPSNVQPLDLKQEVEEGRAVTELFNEPEPKHPNHKGGNHHPY